MSPGKGYPEIRYVYHEDDAGGLHMLPAIEEIVMKSHVKSEQCFCCPKWIQGERKGKIVRMCVHFIVN